MIEEDARIIDVEGEFAWVETQRRSTCGSCAAKQGCGTAALAQVLGTRRTRVRALNTAGGRPGEAVVIGLQEDALLRGSLAVYLVPLAALLGGGLLGQALAANGLGGGEGPVVLGALLGLGGGLGWLRGFTRRIAIDGRYQPVVLRRYPAVPGLAVDGTPGCGTVR